MVVVGGASLNFGRGIAGRAMLKRSACAQMQLARRSLLRFRCASSEATAVSEIGSTEPTADEVVDGSVWKLRGMLARSSPKASSVFSAYYYDTGATDGENRPVVKLNAAGDAEAAILAKKLRASLVIGGKRGGSTAQENGRKSRRRGGKKAARDCFESKYVVNKR